MLVETVGGGEVVAYVSPGVPAGVRVGITLAEARAYCADLVHLPTTPDEDGRALGALARWFTRFSPNVSPCPPDAIYLDATGLERLFGDLPTLCRSVANAADTLRLTTGVAAAPTPGAAWALAAFGRSGPHVVVDRLAIVRAVAPLPIGCLRLDAGVAAMLRALGVVTVGALLALARDDLAVRFGPAVLRRIDEVTGAAPEPLTFLEHRDPICESIEFDGAVDSLETIHLVLRQLVAGVAAELARRGRGARELRVTFCRPYATAVQRCIRLSRASRAAANLFDLLRHAIEANDPGDDTGFLAVRLDVTRSERLAEEQVDLVGGEERRNAAEVGLLVDRLRARLGPAVGWAELVESRTPERAFRPSEVQPANACNHRSAPRPLRLLSEPRAVPVTVTPSESRDGLPVSFTDAGTVHRLPRARGPERICGEWWDGRWKTRDYFDAEDEAGRRYWLFRVAETNRWYLHGVFE